MDKKDCVLIKMYEDAKKGVKCDRIPKHTDYNLGLVLDGQDAIDFWENENNPKVTKKQIEMFKESMRIYKEQFLNCVQE